MSAASITARSAIAAGVRAGRGRGDRLCGRPAHHQRPGHPGAAKFADPHHRRPEGQARRLHQGLQRAQHRGADAGEGRASSYADITPVYLTPPDAGPAFANGSIDAWAIWDPYFAIGETKQNGRILVNAHEVTKTNSFYIANRDFANNHGAILQQIIDVTAETARWAETHRDEVAKALAAVTGVPLDIQTIAANRASFVIGPVTDDIVTTQQGVADRFYKLGLIPKPIVIRDIVWRHADLSADHFINKRT